MAHPATEIVMPVRAMQGQAIDMEEGHPGYSQELVGFNIIG